MPSPVSRIGRGLIGLAFPPRLPIVDRRLLRSFFANVGTVVEVPEAQFDIFTATYSCSHGYHALARLTRAAEKLGLDARSVKRLQKLRQKYGPGPLLLALPFRRQAAPGARKLPNAERAPHGPLPPNAAGHQPQHREDQQGDRHLLDRQTECEPKVRFLSIDPGCEP